MSFYLRVIQSKNFLVSLVLLYSFNLYSQELQKISPLKIEKEYNYVSIVYAHQNLDSIASMFGHTFLVFHNKPEVSAFDLTVEFSVYIKDPGLVLYMRAGAGLINGNFRYNYFYNKKREYEAEGRSLFIYGLKLNTDQIKQLVSDFEDDKKNDYPYSFLRKNCSYYVQEKVSKVAGIRFPYRVAYQPSRFIKSLEEEKKTKSKMPKMLKKSRTEIDCSPFISGGCFTKLKQMKSNDKKWIHKYSPPILDSGHLFFLKSIDGDGLIVDFKESQKSFFQATDDIFRFSSLEVLRANFLITSVDISLLNMNLLKLENLSVNGISKVFDFSLQDHSVSANRKTGTYLNFGLGKGLSIDSFAVHLVPAVKLGMYGLNGLKGDTLFGANVYLSYIFSSKFSARYKVEVFGSELLRKRKETIEVSLKIAKRLYLRYEGLFFQDSRRNQSLGLGYVF